MILLVVVSMIVCDPGLGAPPAYGEYLASECVTCHGANADASIPALDTLRYEQLISRPKGLQYWRPDPARHANIARSLDDAAIEALAAYFSGQP